MAFVTLEDFGGSSEVIVFSSTYASRRDLLQDDNLVVIQGKVSVKGGGESKIIADKIYSIDEALRYLSRRIHLTLREGSFGEKELEGLRETVSRFPGERELCFHWKRRGAEKFMIRSRSVGISPGLELIGELKKITGVEYVEIST